MTRGKWKPKKKQQNIKGIEIDTSKFIKNHPLYGEQYKQEEITKELFNKKGKCLR